MSKKLPVLLFDWDGVIVDSNAWKWGGAWEEALQGEPELLQIMTDVLKADTQKKLPRDRLVESMLERAEAAGSQPQHGSEVYLERFGEAVRFGVVRKGLFPGVKEVLATLHEEGYPMFVISMTAQEDLEYAAAELGVEMYFGGLHGRPGTKEEHANEILSRERADKSVVVGDGEGDRRLAEHLGARFIGIKNEWNNWSDGDIEVVESIEEIVPLIKE